MKNYLVARAAGRLCRLASLRGHFSFVGQPSTPAHATDSYSGNAFAAIPGKSLKAFL
jgi:hypothetical protein